MDSFERRRIFLASLLVFSMLAVLLLAGGLANLEFRPGKSLNLIGWFLAQLAEDAESGLPEITSPPPPFLPEIGDVLMNSLIIAFWILLTLSVVFIFVSPQFRRELIRLLVFIIPLVILLPQIAKSIAEQREQGEEGLAGEFGAFGTDIYPQAPDYIQNPPEWLNIVVNILLITLILVGIIYLWRRLRPKSDAQSVVVREVKRALSDLESGMNLKDVVIACYAQMCQGLQDSKGIRRPRAMTPREFEDHLFRAGFTSTHIQQLTRLFEAVRYGAEPPDEAAEIQAKQSLRNILEVYSE